MVCCKSKPPGVARRQAARKEITGNDAEITTNINR